MRAVIVGLGSIGRRHLRNLRAIVPDSDITVWRHQRPEQESEEIIPDANRVVYTLDDTLAARPDVAIVANPASQHLATAYPLAAEGVHLLIEKPLALPEQDRDPIASACEARGLVAMVGYNLRFSEALQALKAALVTDAIGRLLSVRAEVGQYLPDWRPDQDYRGAVSARHELGGGALMELSHEIDYVCWLAGEVTHVSAVVDRLGDLEMDADDTAELTLRFKGGALGNVHMDMLQRAPYRTCRLIGTTGTLEWDAIANTVRIFEAHTGVWRDLYSVPGADRNAMYVAELHHFLDCVATGRKPLITLEDGARVLAIIAAARQASATGATVALANDPGVTAVGGLTR